MKTIRKPVPPGRGDSDGRRPAARQPGPRRSRAAAALGLVLAAVLAAGCASTPPQRIEPWSVGALDTPESVVLDPASGQLFVSLVGLNQGGSVLDKDGNGAIARLTPQGRVVEARWVTGLDSPKGLAVHAGVLWVADVDQIVSIDIASGTITARLPVEGAQFLNDVTVAPDGTVYVSDTATNRIHRVRDGAVTMLVEGEGLEHPNGLLYENGSLVVAGWGEPSLDGSKASVPGHLFRLDLSSQRKALIATTAFGALDGIAADGQGGYLVSDWAGGRILHVTAGGVVTTLAEHARGTADLTYLPASRTLIVPHMLEGRVAAYNLSGVLGR